MSPTRHKRRALQPQQSARSAAHRIKLLFGTRVVTNRQPAAGVVVDQRSSGLFRPRI